MLSSVHNGNMGAAEAVTLVRIGSTPAGAAGDASGVNNFRNSESLEAAAAAFLDMR
jgi:hypothetical protein